MGKIKNLRSSVEGKLPTADQLEVGQLAVNVNDASPMIAWKTTEDSIAVVKPVKEWVGTQAEYDAITEKDINTTYYIVQA